MEDIDLDGIRLAILDGLRDMPCRERITNVEVYLADKRVGLVRPCPWRTYQRR